jgi:SAM-dependent methyltransferase
MKERMPQPSSFESDFSRALFRWKKAGSSTAACGHSRLGWRSRGALLAKEMAGVRGEVLDLACGNGAFGAKAAWGRDLLLYGVDRDAELLEGARGRGYRELVRGDLRDGLPAELARRRYDAFFCFELLQYLDGPEMFRLFEESKSVAGGEAHFLCILPNRASYWHRARRWAGLGKEDYHCMHDLPQVVAAAQAAGWSLAAGWGCSYGKRQAQELASVHRASPFHAHLLLRFQA